MGVGAAVATFVGGKALEAGKGAVDGFNNGVKGAVGKVNDSADRLHASMANAGAGMERVLRGFIENGITDRTQYDDGSDYRNQSTRSRSVSTSSRAQTVQKEADSGIFNLLNNQESQQAAELGADDFGELAEAAL